MLDFLFAQTEVVTEFMDDRFRHAIANIFVPIARVFDRTLENGDAIGKGIAVCGLALCERRALIEPEQGLVRLHIQLAKQFRRRFIFHHDGDVPHRVPESFRYASDRLFDESREPVSIHLAHITVMVVTLAYFTYLTAVSLVRRRPLPIVVSVATLACVHLVGMRSIMPLIYLLVGYWVPSLLVGTANLSFESRLMRIDHALFGQHGLQTFARRAPRPVIEYLELAYLLCYAVVPMAFAWIVANGFETRADLYWSTVLLASFSCYGLLPWLPTRAPRAVETTPTASSSAIRRLNLAVLDRASVQWNTFPSGHTAASAAAALAVGSVSPAAGGALGVVALSIAVGSIVGRYHYAADAVAGAGLAIVAFVIASAALAP